LNEKRQHRQNASEDQLNTEIVSHLKLVDFNDTQTGGHCDVYIKFKRAVS